MQFDSEQEALDHLTKMWGGMWEIHRSHGEWAADRRRGLSDEEIRAGLEMSLVAKDLQTLHAQISEQGRLEIELLHPRPEGFDA